MTCKSMYNYNDLITVQSPHAWSPATRGRLTPDATYFINGQVLDGYLFIVAK